MSPSLLKNWFATATILSSFSVNCQCFLRGLSPVFRTMSPITSTPWKASWMLTTSIHLLQSMHCYSTCSELYAWSVSEINAQAQWKSFCSVIIQHTSLETQGRSVGPGDKARQKFSSTGGKALGYRLSLDHFQMVKRMLAPDWAQKMLCIILPNRRTPSPEFFSWARTRRLLTCTKEMHAVRNLSVWYKCYISKYW